MSLINQLLQDLDKRRSQPAAEVQLPRGARAISVATRMTMPTPAVWLIALLGCAFVAALYVWLTHSQPQSDAHGVFAAARNRLALPDGDAVIPAITQAQVEATLMAPVFQLSDQLASPPTMSRVALSVDSKLVAPRSKRDKTPPQRSGSGSVQQTAVAASHPEPQSEPDRIAKQRPQTKADAVAASNDDAASSAAAPRIAKATQRPTVLRSEEIEEIDIAADVSVSPIARQTRQLTTYERAEKEFRKGVADLRQGRMSAAETHFRLANDEDRSHVAARQALIGMLIEVGRNADAEEVLGESLSLNPRQPHEAMVLARLQVERGDSDAAIRTLQSVNAYVGSDAGYLSFLAAVLQRASRHEEAATQYRKALALMPRNAIWLMGLGISLRAVGDTDRAKDAFKRAAETGTLSPELQAYVVKQYSELHVAAK
jgi:MSHA biogenesis protein MshN